MNEAKNTGRVSGGTFAFNPSTDAQRLCGPLWPAGRHWSGMLVITKILLRPDTFRSAELLSEAIHARLSGARPLQDAMAEYQRLRDEQVAPMYDLTCEFASLKPPSSEMLALSQALRSNQPEADRFFGTIAGTVPIPEYYAPENLRRIVGGAAAVA